jgi:hypothetical protein
MSSFIRQAHRWLSITFFVAVLANFAVMGQGDIALWIGGATLVPLFLLLASGLYMFILPHIRRWQGRATSRGGAT